MSVLLWLADCIVFRETSKTATTEVAAGNVAVAEGMTEQSGLMELNTLDKEEVEKIRSLLSTIDKPVGSCSLAQTDEDKMIEMVVDKFPECPTNLQPPKSINEQSEYQIVSQPISASKEPPSQPITASKEPSFYSSLPSPVNEKLGTQFLICHCRFIQEGKLTLDQG
ncbi:Hypothetical predicted protein [Olea europaea subsp. europaea]|uniref:Uncharacterized protein n=1 Tax=Olea europaea subsp. europaea TaxID=158383 RepID=A0A8S0SWC4_OLEEU|nr:Hypothetical predicted protein [Olea europaea subsp. europaea]